jgi:predicted AAA+ superfamily ATPase
MLSENEKIAAFEASLAVRHESYGDVMRDEIKSYYAENKSELSFLDKLQTVEEIENKVNFVVSKMILHEHQDNLQNIIVNYI